MELMWLFHSTRKAAFCLGDLPIRRILTALVFMLLSGPTIGQDEESDILGIVVSQTQKGAIRVRGDESTPFDTQVATFSDAKNGLALGDTIGTYPESNAVVTLPEYASIVQLDGDTELQLTEDRLGGRGFPATMTVSVGTVSLLRRADANNWMLLVGQSGQEAGYLLVENGSVTLTVNRSDISCLVLSGEAFWFEGEVPIGPLIDESGAIVPQGGEIVSQGSRRVIRQKDDQVSEGQELVSLAYARIVETSYKFGLEQSNQWVQTAESGDLTPARKPSRVSANAFSEQVGVSSPTFDQPRSQVVAPAPTTPTRAVTAGANPANVLIASGIPTNVVIGQRLRRSRIIGSRGTAGTIGVRFNPNAEQLIRLSGGSR